MGTRSRTADPVARAGPLPLGKALLLARALPEQRVERAGAHRPAQGGVADRSVGRPTCPPAAPHPQHSLDQLAHSRSARQHAGTKHSCKALTLPAAWPKTAEVPANALAC